MKKKKVPSKETYVTRLTWNINGWEKPSGARTKERGTHVAKNGFGHEEWLNRKDCVVDGWQYGFLQGVHKQRKRFAGKKLGRILLYSIKPDSNRVYVGVLESAEVIDKPEEKRVLAQFERKGLLKQMKREVVEAHGKVQAFQGGVNIRFRPGALTIYHNEDFVPVQRVDAVSKENRYWLQPAHPKVVKLVLKTSLKRKPAILVRSVDPITIQRAARLIRIERIEAQMEKEIAEILTARHGEKAVERQRDYKDIKLTTSTLCALIELKASEKTKSALREALGQLLEYAYFDQGNRDEASQLFVIARGSLTPETRQYLEYLKGRFSLQINYLQYRPGSHQLEGLYA